MTTKKKRQPRKSPAEISVGGDVGGIGNVIGHGSTSHVQIKTDSHSRLDHNTRAPWLWVRLLTFLMAVAGVLGMVTVFMRLLQSVETWALVQLALAVIVAALGISGTIKPQAVVELLAKLLGKE